jgi:hypothetical protein
MTSTLRMKAVHRVICLVLLVTVGWAVVSIVAPATSSAGAHSEAPSHTPSSQEVLAGLRSPTGTADAR